MEYNKKAKPEQLSTFPYRYEAIYARQSLDVKDSISVDTQIELCRKETSPGLECKVYVDKGYSGKNINRPQFQQLLKDIENGLVQRVICYRLDRISRSVVDFGGIWEIMSSKNVEFVSVNEKFDTSTPVGRAMLYIIMVFAQLERETISERITDNYYARTKKGAWPGGPAPYGFKIRSGKGPARLVPDSRLDLIPGLFERYASYGESLGNIAKSLNQQHIPCSWRDTWDSVSLARVLRQPAYARCDSYVYSYYRKRGVIFANDISEFDGVHGATLVGKRDANTRKYTDMNEHVLSISLHEGVVPGSLFVKVQEKLDTNKQIKNTGKGKYTWLTGLLKCKDCGYSLHILPYTNTRGETTKYAYCSGRHAHTGCTNTDRIDITYYEKQVAMALQSKLATVIPVSEISAEEKTELEKYRQLIIAGQEKIRALIDVLPGASPATLKYVNAEIERIEQETVDAESRLSKIEHTKLTSQHPTRLDVFSLDFDEKRELAATLIEKIMCFGDDPQIIWKA